MISLMFALACGGDSTTGTAGTDTGASDTGSGATDSGPATEVTDTVSFYGTAPAEPVPLPDFAAINQYGEPRGPDDLLGHATVLWFYPLAETPG